MGRAALFLALVVPACSAACLFSLGEVHTPQRWCDANGGGALYCEDFDHAQEPFGWTWITVDSGTQTASLTSDWSVSPPYAFRFGVTGLPLDAGCSCSAGDYESSKEAQEVHLAFDLRIEALPAGDEPVIVYIGTSKPVLNSLQIRAHSIDAKSVYILMHDETGSSPDTQWSGTLDVAKWTRIFVDLILAPSPSVSASTGAPGSALGSPVANLTLTDAWKPGTPGFNVGIGFTGTPGDVVLVDNVVFSAKER